MAIFPVSGNPAARLHAVLREAKKRGPDERVQGVWASVFLIEATDLVHLMKCLVALSELADRVEEEILRLDVSHEIFLKHLPVIRKVIGISNWEATWREARAMLAEEVLMSLEFCSERLNAVRPEKVLSSEDFQQISQQIDDLFATIDGADLPRELREVLLDVTQILHDALAQYRIRGVDGLRKELFIVLDRLQRIHTQLNHERTNPAVQAVFKALGYWDTITSVALNTPQLLHAVLALT